MITLLISHNSDNHKTGANRVKEDGGFPLPLLLQLGVALLGSLALLVSRVHWRPHPQGTCSAFACDPCQTCPPPPASPTWLNPHHHRGVAHPPPRSHWRGGEGGGGWRVHPPAAPPCRSGWGDRGQRGGGHPAQLLKLLRESRRECRQVDPSSDTLITRHLSFEAGASTQLPLLLALSPLIASLTAAGSRASATTASPRPVTSSRPMA